MKNQEKYVAVIEEIIAKQAVILGPHMAILKARSIPGITITENGKVTKLEGNGDAIVEALIDTYVNLSGEIIKGALGSILTKHTKEA